MQITKLKLLFAISLLLCLVTWFGCEHAGNPEKENEQPSSMEQPSYMLLKQEWKLVKAVEDEKNVDIPPKEFGGDNAYVIQLEDFEKFKGMTACNDLFGIVTIDTVHHEINFKIEMMTEVNETLFGKKYLEFLEKIKK